MQIPLVPPLFDFNGARPGVCSSCGSGHGLGGSNRSGLRGSGGLGDLGIFTVGSLLGGGGSSWSLRGRLLCNGLSLGDWVGSRLLILLDSLAGLTEELGEGTRLLRLTLGGLTFGFRLLLLLATEVAEERCTALLLEAGNNSINCSSGSLVSLGDGLINLLLDGVSGSLLSLLNLVRLLHEGEELVARGWGSDLLGLLGLFSGIVIGSSNSLRLDWLGGRSIDRVAELGSGARDSWGLRTDLLLGLVMVFLGELLEEGAKNGGTLRLDRSLCLLLLGL